jgi:hypothetical protein
MTFQQFWPQYLALHTHKLTKVMHAVGLLAAYFTGFCALIRGQYWYLAAAPMIGYGFAFSAHFWVEHNKPASFTHPVLSFMADHLMLWKLLKGEIS